MEQSLQPISLIRAQCKTITEHAKKLRSVPDRFDLMKIGTAAEAVAHEIEQVLKWGPDGQH